MSYSIFTDSSCDLPQSIVNDLEINVVSLSLLVDGEPFCGDDKEQVLKSFYTKIKGKNTAVTSCVNSQSFVDAFKAELTKGNDIIYIGFSSNLSRTYFSALEASKELKKSFPDREITCIDSLCASLGEGLLVYETAKKRKAGASYSEAVSFAESNKLKVCHLFTVDELESLYRGGRVSRGAYVIGNISNIKPIMNMDNEGRLKAAGKAIGRKRALIELADRLNEKIEGSENQTVFISHGDSMEDVEFLKSKIAEKTGIKRFVVNFIDPIIGAHSGAGTIAVFFFANER